MWVHKVLHTRLPHLNMIWGASNFFLFEQFIFPLCFDQPCCCSHEIGVPCYWFLSESSPQSSCEAFGVSTSRFAQCDLVNQLSANMKAKAEQRAEIWFCVCTGMSRAESYQRLQGIHGANCLSKAQFNWWFKHFESGDLDLADKPCTGQPVKFTQAKQKLVGELCPCWLMQIHRNFVPWNWIVCGNNLQRFEGVAHEDKKCQVDPAFPECCTKIEADHCSQGKFATAKKACHPNGQSLNHHRRRKLGVLLGSRIEKGVVTMAQTGWRSTAEGAHQEVHCQDNVGDFFDSAGVIYHEFVPRGQGITAARYQKILTSLIRAVRRKRPVLHRNGWWLLHDNAPTHWADPVQRSIRAQGLQQVPHPGYLLDISPPPPDYWLFNRLKKLIKGEQFACVDHLQVAVDNALAQIDQAKFRSAMEHYPTHLRKVIAACGHYFEWKPDSNLFTRIASVWFDNRSVKNPILSSLWHIGILAHTCTAWNSMLPSVLKLLNKDIWRPTCCSHCVQIWCKSVDICVSTRGQIIFKWGNLVQQRMNNQTNLEMSLSCHLFVPVLFFSYLQELYHWQCTH